MTSGSRWLLAVLLCGAWRRACRRSETPDLEFLEYLGGLVQEDEAWVGPDDMAVSAGRLPRRGGDDPITTTRSDERNQRRSPMNGHDRADGTGSWPRRDGCCQRRCSRSTGARLPTSNVTCSPATKRNGIAISAEQQERIAAGPAVGGELAPETRRALQNRYSALAAALSRTPRVDAPSV